MDETGSKRSTIAFFVIIGLLIIGFFSALAKSSNTLRPLPTSHASEENILQTKLTSAFQEHSSLLATALRHDYSHYPDEDAIHEQLYQNVQAVGDIFAKIRDKNAQNQYMMLSTQHDQLFFNYLIAIKTNNKQAIETSLANIRQHEDRLLAFFLKVDPHLSKAISTNLLEQDDVAMQAMLDAYIMKHYDESYIKQHDAEILSSGLAALVARDIAQEK